MWSDEDARLFGSNSGYGVRSAYLGADGNRIGPVNDLVTTFETGYMSPKVRVVDLGPEGAFPMVSAVRRSFGGCTRLVFRMLSAEGTVAASECGAA